MDIPEVLQSAIDRRRCIVFCGAGISMEAGLPEPGDIKQMLTDMIRDRLPGYDSTAKSLDEVAGEFEEILGTAPLREMVSEMLTNGVPSEAHRLIARHFRFIVTGGLDNLYEEALYQEGIPFHRIYSDETVDQFDPTMTNLIKLHGSLDDPDTMVITNEDIEHYEDDHQQLRALLAEQLAEHVTVFLGYTLQDETLRHLYSDMEGMMANTRPPRFEVGPPPDEIKRMLLSRRGIHVISASPLEFLHELERRSAGV